MSNTTKLGFIGAIALYRFLKGSVTPKKVKNHWSKTWESYVRQENMNERTQPSNLRIFTAMEYVNKNSEQVQGVIKHSYAKI